MPDRDEDPAEPPEVKRIRSGVIKMYHASPAIKILDGAFAATRAGDAVAKKFQDTKSAIGGAISGGARRLASTLEPAEPAPASMSTGGGRDIELPKEKSKSLASPRAMRGGRR